MEFCDVTIRSSPTGLIILQFGHSTRMGGFPNLTCKVKQDPDEIKTGILVNEFIFIVIQSNRINQAVLQMRSAIDLE